jgi:hypothetical protein
LVFLVLPLTVSLGSPKVSHGQPINPVLDNCMPHRLEGAI